MELRGSKTEKNLWEAFAGESQARNKYTYFASKAKKEGYEQISAIFTETANNEKEHAKIWFKLWMDHEERYKALAANIEAGKVYARETEQVWQCRNCGFVYIGQHAPVKCPVCAHPQSYFELKSSNY